MKIKVSLITVVSLIIVASATAQKIENDDMYFNAKDRAALRAQRGNDFTMASVKDSRGTDKQSDADDNINPTDSYSARNVNPEYTSRSQSQTAQADDGNYFVNHYNVSQYNRNQLNNWNNNFNNWYGSSWYRPSYYSTSIYGWNSPYYGSAYDNWGNPCANPYYQSGFSTAFSFYGGMGMGYGYGNPYNSWSPYYGSGFGYSSFYSPYSYGSPYGISYYGYPSRVVVIENGSNRGVVYGKRNSRSSQQDRNYYNGSTRTTSDRGYADSNGGGRSSNGGRISNSSSQPHEYYNRSWKNQQNMSTPSYGNSGSGNARSSWENQNRSSWRDSNFNNSNSTPSRSFDTGRSGGGFSGGGSSSGGGGGSGSRSGGHHR